VGFVCDQQLEDMVDPRAVTVAGRAMTDKGGSRLAEATRVRTPIDTSPTLGLPRLRPRGTARESIMEGDVRQHVSTGGRGWEKRAFTEDPIFPYIEWNTRPHEIRPTLEHEARVAAENEARAPGQPKKRAALRFPGRDGVTFRGALHHPGTTGQHPFARAAAFIETEVPGMFDVELERFGHDLTNGVRTVDDLLAF
jgi:hypothetical protein